MCSRPQDVPATQRPRGCQGAPRCLGDTVQPRAEGSQPRKGICRLAGSPAVLSRAGECFRQEPQPEWHLSHCETGGQPVAGPGQRGLQGCPASVSCEGVAGTAGTRNPKASERSPSSVAPVEGRGWAQSCPGAGGTGLLPFSAPQAGSLLAAGTSHSAFQAGSVDFLCGAPSNAKCP